MQVKNRIHVVLLKSCKSLKEGLIKIHLPRWLFLWLEACLFKNSLQFSGSSHPHLPAAQSISSFIQSPQWKIPAIYPLPAPPTEIELRAQEKYKITSQCRA